MAQGRRYEIAKYVGDIINEDDFQRGLDINDEVLGFTNYNTYIQYQYNKISHLSETELLKLESIKNIIIPHSDIMRTETGIRFNINGFVYDSNGVLVFVNKR